MRLIDVDKLKRIYAQSPSAPLPSLVTGSEIDSAPTVEAIPIEWIKEYASMKSFNDEMDCYWHFWEEDVLKMIDVWEKENAVL